MVLFMLPTSVPTAAATHRMWVLLILLQPDAMFSPGHLS